MKRKILFLTSFLFFTSFYCQVGIGTGNPRGALDINKPTTNNMGLVLPSNETPNNLINPQGGNVAVGTIMYDTTLNCVKVYKPTGWSNCLCDTCSTTSGFTLDCSGGALTGTYTQGTLSNGTKVINYSGGNGQPYGAMSIPSAGVTGLTATALSGTLATGNGSITFNISGTPNNSGTASFTVNLQGQSCTFSVNVEQQVRTMRVLSIIPDDWASNLSTDASTTIARSKLNNTSNFGPSGTVKIQGFSFSTINVTAITTDQAFATAIDNADIIWVGYIANGNFPQSKRDVLLQKINEKKKFFFLGADGDIAFFPFSSFGNYSFISAPNGQSSNISSNAGPASGIFGNLAPGAVIKENRYLGIISDFPAGAQPFMNTQAGRTHAIINDNLVIVGDINWYINSETTDGFTGGTSSCTENNNSTLFCNIFEKAIGYVLSH